LTNFNGVNDIGLEKLHTNSVIHTNSVDNKVQ